MGGLTTTTTHGNC